MSTEIASKVSEEYGLELRVQSGLNLDSTHAAGFTKSSLNLLADSEDRPYLLKKIPSAYFLFTPPHIYFEGLSYVLDELRKKSIPIVNYLLTLSDKVAIEVNDTYYVLYPYVEADVYSGTLEEIASTAQQHANMNAILSRMLRSKVDLIKQMKNPFLRKEDLSVLFDRVSSKASKIDSEDLASTLEYVLPIVERNLTVIDHKTYDNLPHQVVHKDVWPFNLLYRDNRVKVILDPDEAMYLPRIRDVAYSMWCFSTRSPTGEIEGPNIAKAATYLRNYLANASLTKEEIEILPETCIRIWVEDFLNFTLNSNLTVDSRAGLDKKVQDIQYAVTSRKAIYSIIKDFL